MPIYGETILGRRCIVTFQVSHKVRQTCEGSVTEYKAKLRGSCFSHPGGGENDSGSSGSSIIRQHLVEFDNGNKLWMDFEKEDIIIKDYSTTQAESAEPPTKKRKNSEQDDADTPLSITSSALKDVLPRTVAFLGDALDRSTMALTHKQLRDAVELRSKEEWTHILEPHGVDDTFEARVDELTNQIPRQPEYRQQQQRLEQFYRCRVSAAKRTHLYTLVGPPLNTEGVFTAGVRFFALNQPNTRLLVMTRDIRGEDAHVRIWNLDSKKCIYSWQVTCGWVQDVQYFDEHVVICSGVTIRVFRDLTGEQLYEFKPSDGIFSFLRHGGNILFSNEKERVVYSFDVRSGDGVQKVMDLEGGNAVDDRQSEVLLAGVCNDKWLVVFVGRDAKEKLPSGIYVYDLSNSSKNHFLRQGSRAFVYRAGLPTLKQSIYSLTTFYAMSGNRASLLELSSEGILVRERTVTVQHERVLASFRARSRRIFVLRNIPVVWETPVLNTNDDSLTGCFRGRDTESWWVQDAETGSEHLLSESLAVPPVDMIQVVKYFAANEKEFFVGATMTRDENGRLGDKLMAGDHDKVKAYLSDAFANNI